MLVLSRTTTVRASALRLARIRGWFSFRITRWPHAVMALPGSHLRLLRILLRRLRWQCRRENHTCRSCSLRRWRVLNDEGITTFRGVRLYTGKKENQGNYCGKVKRDASFHQRLP